MSERRSASPDERYDLAARAAAVERSNRPRHLVVLGGLVLVVALISLGAAAVSLQSARGELDRSQRRNARIAELGATYLALRDAPREQDDAIGEPIGDLLTRFTSLATEAGVTTSPGVPRPATDRGEGIRRLRYTYDVRDPSLEALLRWAELVTTRIPATRVHSITVRPEARAWRVEITFARLERTP